MTRARDTFFASPAAAVMAVLSPFRKKGHPILWAAADAGRSGTSMVRRMYIIFNGNIVGGGKKVLEF